MTVTERLAAYSGPVAALNEFRRAQLDWFNPRLEDPDGAAAAAARTETYTLRGGAFTALTNVRLVVADPGLVAAAAAAYDATQALSDAQDESDVRAKVAAAKRGRGRVRSNGGRGGSGCSWGRTEAPSPLDLIAGPTHCHLPLCAPFSALCGVRCAR